MRFGHLLAALAAVSLAACSSSSSSSSPADPAAYPTAKDQWDGGAGDGTLASASAIAVGGQQVRTLFPNGDTDWVKVALTAGTAYEFSAYRLSTATDLYMWLFDTDGVTTLLDSDDYVYRDPRIKFTPSADGTYYLRIWSYDMDGGSVDGLGAYTLSAHLFVDADGDLQSSFYDCNDADASIYLGNDLTGEATDTPGDGIDQNCDGFDTPTGLVADAAEPDDTYQTARTMALAQGAVFEAQFRRETYAANLRTLPAVGDVDWFKLSLPAHGGAFVVVYDNGGSVSLEIFDSDGTTSIVAGALAQPLSNPTAAAKTFYVRYTSALAASWVVPVAYSVGVDLDGDHAHSQDFDGDRDCNDADPSIYPGAPEALGDGIDSNCDGSDDT